MKIIQKKKIHVQKEEKGLPGERQDEIDIDITPKATQELADRRLNQSQSDTHFKKVYDYVIDSLNSYDI